ncbi:MAG TPA: hypothetical protein VF587_15040 [Solirubrobacteraceae bacterium]
MSGEGAPPPRLLWLKRSALVSASALAAINIWTGAPLLAVWVGSQAAAGSRLSMGAVGVVIVVLAASCIALTMAVSWLSARYDELTGRPPEARRTSPWLRSMRGEREQEARRRHGISPIERVIVIVVVLGVLAFEVWFFFFAGSSLPSQ